MDMNLGKLWEMNLGKLWELVMDRGACHAAVYGVTKDQAQLSNWTEVYQLQTFLVDIVYQVERVSLYF